MSHPAKSLHAGVNWQHNLLEHARINSQRGNGCSCRAVVLGHARFLSHRCYLRQPKHR